LNKNLTENKLIKWLTELKGYLQKLQESEEILLKRYRSILRNLDVRIAHFNL
jgi:hypothetical protein